MKTVFGSNGKRERDLTQQVQGNARIVPLLQCIESEDSKHNNYKVEMIFPYLRPFSRRLTAIKLREAMRDILQVCTRTKLYIQYVSSTRTPVYVFLIFLFACRGWTGCISGV